MRKLFTERRDGSKPRTSETLDTTTKQELLLLVAQKYDAQWFAFTYPATCPDGNAHVAGTDDQILGKKLASYNLPRLFGLARLEESEFSTTSAGVSSAVKHHYFVFDLRGEHANG